MDKPQDAQIILGADDRGNFTGEYFPKAVGHTGKGKRHLAITVLLYNSKGEVLLQRRKHKVFDDIWDFTGATHPLHDRKGKDETFEEATLRCLKREYDIAGVQLENLGSFNYYSEYGDLCENEHCAMIVGEYNGKLNLNPKVGYDSQWMDNQAFLTDIVKNPKNYSPWAVEGVKILKGKGFFD